MDPKRLEQVDRIFQTVLDLAPDRRVAFLDVECGNDTELRAEVESLLAAHQSAGDFIEDSASDIAASLVEKHPQRPTQVGQYKIEKLLGAGGMGEVYQATDRLGRRVALKLLASRPHGDQQHVARFLQEAQTLLALNHPNIVTIYDIGETNGSYYIASELIEGENLRQHLETNDLELGSLLEIAIQVATALTAAHEKGIVHRDIKPENVMIRPDGYAKVLDFGIAKLTEDFVKPVSTEAPTAPKVETSEGLVVGTAAYMSPEQARGLAVDARTDIWSCGVMLYEMLTGHAAFAGESTADTVVNILSREPPPLVRYMTKPPVELQRIINKALMKNREERYQTIKDMLLDLKALKQELEFAAKLQRSDSGSELPVTEKFGARSSGRMSAAERQTFPAERDSVSPQPASSAEFIFGEIKRHKSGLIITLAVLAVFVLAGLVGFYRFIIQKSSNQTGTRTNAVAGQNMKIQRLTANGKVEGAAISPDGKYVAYVVKDGNRQSLWTRLITVNSSPLQIVSSAEVNYSGQTFSPDDTSIYYVTSDSKNALYGALYQVPVLGGATKRILTNIASSIAFSPDGQRFAFLRNDESSSGEDQLIVANADGTNERKLAARKGDTWFPPFGGGVAWSPDGKVIACPAGSYSGGYHESVVAVEVETGNQKEFTPERWLQAGGVAWLADGSGLVVNAKDMGSPFSQIWELSYPRGDVRRVINDLNDYGGISLTADSNAFVTVQGDWSSNIWTAPANELDRAHQITSGKLEGGANNLPPAGTTNLAWTPDGRLVYTSMASGNLNVWIMNQDGTTPQQLTTDPSIDWMPAVSPDGRQIVFVSYRGGLPSLWRMDVDGRNLKQLTDREDRGPQISPDGRWIVFVSFRSGKLAIWKMPIDGGAPVQLSDKFADGQAISPDGKLVAAFYLDEKPGSPWRIVVVPFEGGPIVKTFDLPPTVDIRGGVRWTPDGRALTYIDARGTPNLWSQPYDGGLPKQLTHFEDPGVWQRAWSRDDKQVAFVRGTVTKDVVLIKDFR
jgi:serine/threonine protein kinase/dipeptidyl aminopeptidase/acylaminoacyl peptidase